MPKIASYAFQDWKEQRQLNLETPNTINGTMNLNKEDKQTDIEIEKQTKASQDFQHIQTILINNIYKGKKRKPNSESGILMQTDY